MTTTVAMSVTACQLIVFVLAVWCQLTPRLRTGSIATTVLGCLAIASLLGLSQPTDTALHLLFWLPVAALLVVVVINKHSLRRHADASAAARQISKRRVENG